MKKMYIKGSQAHAGGPIYRGFERAWEQVGYKVCTYSSLHDLTDEDDEYELMLSDSEYASPWYGSRHNHIISGYTLEESQYMYKMNIPIHHKILQRAKKAYMFVQPTFFAMPWVQHANYVSWCRDSPLINEINELEHVKLWHWNDILPENKKEWYGEWKEYTTIPLAFDSISYKQVENKEYEYDICFVGGWVDNGLNEKRSIMIEHFRKLMSSNLKCGIFVGKNISHEHENLLLYNSKLTLNIHDAYQRILGNDTNERTFKSLGLGGALVTDNIRQIRNIFPDLPMFSTPDEMMMLIDRYLTNPELLKKTKKHYRNEIATKHTYIDRVKQMMEL